MNRTILEKIRCLLSNVGLSQEFWAEAIVHMCHLINHLPLTAIDGKTPMEMWIINLLLIMTLYYMLLVLLLVIM